MRLLLIDKAGDGILDLAIRAQNEGHLVKYFLRDFDPVKRPVGQGLVEMVDDWRRWMEWADLVLLSANDLYMAEMNRWRAQGVRVIGGDDESAAWESDRALGMRVFKKAGIPVPPYQEFTRYDDAIQFVKRTDRGYACKPCGHCDDKSLSFVGKTAEDTIWRLERWKEKGQRAGLEFILQETIDGIEMGVGAWWGTAGWGSPWEENFEFKKLMPGDRGPNTGEMGTVMRFVSSSKLANQVLKPLEPQLRRLEYVGCIDVNCIIDEEGTPWPLEFTMRCGWPAFNIQQALYDGDPIEWLVDLYEGRGAYKPKLNEIALGVVMALPPFPYSHAQTPEIVGVPIRGLTPGLLPHFHPAEIKLGKQGTESAGEYVAVMSGTGKTVKEASYSTYRRLKKLSMPASMFYRNDIGARLKKELPLLQTHGYARGLMYGQGRETS